MLSVRPIAAAVVVAGLALAAGAGVVAQGALAQLGLTETAARNFVLNEITSPAVERRADIAIAGTRAFLKLPPAARGPAATALFAWAKTYVNSAAFTASYDSYRRGRTPQTRPTSSASTRRSRKTSTRSWPGSSR